MRKSNAAVKIQTESFVDGSETEVIDLGHDDTVTTEDIIEAISEAPVLAVTYETIKERKARRPSSVERGDDGKILRKGKNLSGNLPFRRKVYALTKVAPKEAILAAPMQVQLILKYLVETKATGTGGDIVAGAIERGFLRTKIDPPVLFAYYRRLLETLGVEHVA